MRVLDLARVLGFNTIKNEWFTVLDPDMHRWFTG